jgi:uncharacterized protein
MTGPRRRHVEKPRAPQKRAAPFRCRLVVMAKKPVAGAVKTRLAREIGAGAAVRFARQAAAVVLQRVAHDPRWHTILAVTPDAGRTSRCWPRGIPRLGQGQGDLGRRMQHIFECVPPGPAIIVGSDIPSIRRAHIAQAFRSLGRHDAVFGPAADGGYWLIGLRRRPRLLDPFGRVRWSSPHALGDTLANLAGHACAFVATLSDVDDAQGFHLTAGEFGRRVPPPSPS